MRTESEWELEDWVTYHTAKCGCSGHFQCCGCTIKELEESWRRTLQVERSVFASLRRAHDELKQRIANASDGNPA